MTIDRGVESARQALRVAFGVVPFLAGLDKFFNLLADWPRYLNPAAEAMLPVTAQTFMHFAGVVEMVVGLAILTRWTVLGSYVAAAWLVAIAANLVASGTFLDVAVRDLVMATAAYTLARLTEASESTRTPAAVPVDAQADRTRLGKVA
ncbi:MAG: DoxX family membrane protein [Deltaproteobacteria bacterium]|nr:MAG: DoxX family membrane protein [Deltaproteobacteria bacterium]